MNYQHKKLMRKWECICVLCGEGFENIDSVTREHLVPQSMGGTNNAENLAVSHFVCNQLRGNLSLVEAAILIGLRKQELGNKFNRYINRGVPHRYPLRERDANTGTHSSIG
jgi:hypothetical protein